MKHNKQKPIHLRVSSLTNSLGKGSAVLPQKVSSQAYTLERNTEQNSGSVDLAAQLKDASR